MKSEDQTVLEARARKLAEPVKQESGEMEQVVVEFHLLPERFALPAGSITEVIPLVDFTPVPGAPSFVVGVINFRGKVLPVIHLRNFLNLPAKGISTLNKVIVVKTGDVEVGLLADEIGLARTFAADDLTPAPMEENGEDKRYISGITGDGLILLDLEQVFASERMNVNQ